MLIFLRDSYGYFSKKEYFLNTESAALIKKFTYKVK